MLNSALICHNPTVEPLKDLNLLDGFLFAEATENPVIMQNMLEILLDKEIHIKYPPQAEKEKRISSLRRYVKLDVWAWDTEGAVYDTEVQAKNTHNLPKRSRLYQALIDVKLLPPGEVDFNQLNKVYVILITPFDLFGYGFYEYTFEEQCREVPGLCLKDDAIRIFYNTHGTNNDEVNPELVELLHYIEHTTEEVSRNCKSERIKEMQRHIEAIKSSEEIGVKYMQAWEEKIYDRNEGKQEGKAEDILELLEDLGTVPQELKKIILEQSNLDILRRWLKLAAKAETIEEFKEKM